MQSQGEEDYAIGLNFCWQNSGFFQNSWQEQGGFGAKAHASLWEPWSLYGGVCGFTTRNGETDVDLGGFDDVNISSNGGLWGDLGIRRVFWGIFSVESGLYFLEDNAWYLLKRYDSDSRLVDSKEVKKLYSLLGVGGSLGLQFVTDGGTGYFADVGYAKYFYDFTQKGTANYLYKTSHVGISFGL